MMHTQFRFFLTACSFLLLTTQAFALDQARWTGFYAGGNIGAIQSNVNMQTSVAPGGLYFNYTQDAPQVYAAGMSHAIERNFSGGLFAGYEHQFANLVVGAEISANRLSLRNFHAVADRFTSDPNIRFVVNQSFKANWQQTLRLKLGYAQPCWLAYVTGGAARTAVKYTSSYSDDNAQPGSGLPGAYGASTASRILTGWALGAGGEYALNDIVSIKVEYLYSDYGNVKATYPNIPTPTLSEFPSSMIAKASLTVQSLMVGLTCRFA